MNLLDRAIAAVSPSWGLARTRARQAMAYYEAARPDRQRQQRKDFNGPNVPVRAAGATLRAMSRHMAQNNPHVRCLLRDLTNNTVGPNGIGIEPCPRRADGSIHEEFARQLADMHEEWSAYPEVTGEHDRGATERLLASSLYRDGEVLAKLVEGQFPAAPHWTDVPFSVQMLEADHLPLGYDAVNSVPGVTPADTRVYPIYDGIELNSWGARRAYWMYDQHPGESTQAYTFSPSSLRRVPAEQMLHLALRDRIHQRRGVCVLPAALEDLDDLDDYEQSEQVAAKVAAKLGAQIIKGDPSFFNDVPVSINDDDGATASREIQMRAGMIFDDLRPGERVEMIGNNNRPNNGMIDFRYALLRKVAAATGVSASSIMRAYLGTYSAQRQELVENWITYAVLSSEFIMMYTRPVYERMVNAALLTGRIMVPRDVNPRTVTRALYIPPSMPWIDPSKEASAWLSLEQAGHASGPEIIRRRGQSPAAVRDAEIAWRRSWADQGQKISADPASAATPAPAEPNTQQVDENAA